jgi:hypothetical protein
MGLWSLLQQGVLALHLVAAALTAAAVLHEDWRLMTQRRIVPARLARTARAVALGLSVLWTSGIVLVALGVATNGAGSAFTPKLAAKLLVVSLLTLNGVVLHARVFARWWHGDVVALDARHWDAVALGSVSGASWVGASLLGAFAACFAGLSLLDFGVIYAAAVGTTVAIVLLALCVRHAAPAAEIAAPAQIGREKRSPGRKAPQTTA